jgi:hypothetical protein
MLTPWGESDYQKTLASGIISYGTPSHGGIHVGHCLNQHIHPKLRNENGWYEEDCEWAKVAFTFPGAFKPEDHEIAITTLKNDYPYGYMAATGQKICPVESYALMKEAFNKAHEEHLMILSATGDWHADVPKGMVQVIMIKGKDLNHCTHVHDHALERCFLVPKEDYIQPFVIVDEKKYLEVSQLTRYTSKKEVESV